MVRKATLASVLAKAAVGIRFNEHLEFDDGEAVFAHACRMGGGRHRVQAEGLDLPLRPLAKRAQDEEPGVRGGEAGDGRGLGEMTTLTMLYMRGHFHGDRAGY